MMLQSSISLVEIKNSLIYDFKSESELVKEIEKLSLNFTSKRERLNDYLTDRKMVSAYSCFYLLTNMPKLKACFEKLAFDFDKYNLA